MQLLMTQFLCIMLNNITQTKCIFITAF